LNSMDKPRLLTSKKIVIRHYNDICHTDVLKLLRSMRQKKYGMLEAACDVEQIDKDRYNVRMEYISK
jgi:hypothetical protein